MITIIYLAAVASLTLQPQAAVYPGGAVLWVTELLARFPVTAWMDLAVVEFGANVIMFVPFGVLFSLLLGRRRWWLVLISAFAATMLIETAQLFIPNRFSDPRDLLANTLGAAIGLVGTLVVRRPERAAVRAPVG